MRLIYLHFNIAISILTLALMSCNDAAVTPETVASIDEGKCAALASGTTCATAIETLTTDVNGNTSGISANTSGISANTQKIAANTAAIAFGNTSAGHTRYAAAQARQAMGATIKALQNQIDALNTQMTCPSDMKSVGDFCIDNTIASPKPFSNARKLCADAKRHLCTFEEVTNACTQNTVVFSSRVQTSSVFYLEPNGATGAIVPQVVVMEPGTVSLHDTTNTLTLCGRFSRMLASRNSVGSSTYTKYICCRSPITAQTQTTQ